MEMGPITLTETDKGFVLRNSAALEGMSEMIFSDAELLGVMETISLWQDRILQRLRAKSGLLEPIISHPVDAVRLQIDALQANVLVALRVPSGGEATYSLPLHIADYAAQELPVLLAQIARPDGQSYS
jgi:hypothetical protein